MIDAERLIELPDVSPKMHCETLISPATAALCISFKLYILFMRKVQTKAALHVSQKGTKIIRKIWVIKKVTYRTFWCGLFFIYFSVIVSEISIGYNNIYLYRCSFDVLQQGYWGITNRKKKMSFIREVSSVAAWSDKWLNVFKRMKYKRWKWTNTNTDE